MILRQFCLFLQAGLTLSKSMVPGISSENQDQPSPISVLEPPFEDDNAVVESLGCVRGGQLGNAYSFLSLYYCYFSKFLFDIPCLYCFIT